MNRTMVWRILVVSAMLPAVSWPQGPRRFPSDTLAVIGRKVITSEQFARLFQEKVLKLGLSDNGETRNGYLRNLVDDEVLIARARNTGLDRTPEARRELKRIRLQELLNAYADRHVAAKVEVTERDLRNLRREQNRGVRS